MKTIFRVAGTELRTMFYSPIAWFVLIVFMMQTGIMYFELIKFFATTQEAGGDGMRFLDELMSKVFTGKSGIFTSIMENLYLYIPLLTMGLISREMSTGTIKLLYSSPIKVREIILGKYFAMMAYSLLLVAVVAIYALLGISHIQFADKGVLLTALVGLYLLLCAYSAIGLFMSCLTNYQIVAAVATFVMIAVLSYIGKSLQSVAFIKEITYFLSIAGRTQKMLNGLLTSKDVIYFVVIIYMFLGLAILKLKSGMESRSWMTNAGRYLAVVAIGLIIGYIGSLPSLIGYYDATTNQKNTLRPNVQKIIQELGDEPLEVSTYSNIMAVNMYMGSEEASKSIEEEWEPYQRFKKGHNIIIHKTIQYYDTQLENGYQTMGNPGKTLKQMAEQKMKANGLSSSEVKSPEEIRKIIDLRPELNRYVMQLKYKGRTTFLRVFDDFVHWPTETEVSAAFKRLKDDKAPKIAFLKGHLERDIDKKTPNDYRTIVNAKQHRSSLINQGFDVAAISLETHDVPSDVSILVIADPKLQLDSASIQRIKQYIAEGGNLMLLCEPDKNSPLNPILKELGLSLMPGRILQANKDREPEDVAPNLTKFGSTMTKTLEKLSANPDYQFRMQGVAGFQYSAGNAFSIHPLLVTDTALAWNRVKDIDPLLRSRSIESMPIRTVGGPIPVEPEPSANVSEEGTLKYEPTDGDSKGEIPVALALTREIRGKQQRIIVTGDADFIDNELRTPINLFLSLGSFSWLSYGAFPVDSMRPDEKDKRLDVTTNQVTYFRTIFLWILPAALLLFAAILLIRRKRK